MTGRFDVPVAGGTLAAFRFGSGSSPAVIAAHGTTSSSHTWLGVARALGDEAALIAPDLRGRGASNALPRPYGLAAHAADLLAVLEHFRLERAVFLGHSLGAYIVARLAADHPERVQAVVLVDGGLPIPASEGVDPQEFLDAFLGPALARLKLEFRDRQEYREWWRRHPALAGKDVPSEDLDAYADHDLVGSEPSLRSSVVEEAVRADGVDLADAGATATSLAVPASLLCAPRGLLDDPHPMQPIASVQAWAAGAPAQRRFAQVPDTNHYTIVLGDRGARAVAGEVKAMLSLGQSQ